jgi:hypothetical protein
MRMAGAATASAPIQVPSEPKSGTARLETSASKVFSVWARPVARVLTRRSRTASGSVGVAGVSAARGALRTASVKAGSENARTAKPEDVAWKASVSASSIMMRMPWAEL